MDDPLHKHGRFFDVWSHFYRHTLFGLQLRRIQKVALERLRIVPGQRVLDVGCGPGDGAALINAGGATAVGLDYSQGMLETANRTPQNRGRLARGDAGRLPFKDGAFDKIICTNSFHHYPEQAAALREMRRVLKPGGLLVLVDPRKDHVLSRFAIDFGENVVFGLKEVRIHSLAEWVQLLRDAGFSDARVDAGPLWQPLARAEVFVEATA